MALLAPPVHKFIITEIKILDCYMMETKREYTMIQGQHGFDNGDYE